MLSIVKNTGRIFWIVNYFIIIMSILIIYKFFDKKKSLIILLSIFFIQLADGSASINSRFSSFKPFNVGVELNEKFWGKLLSKSRFLFLKIGTIRMSQFDKRILL